MGSPISPADVINICKYVWTVCEKYKSSVDEFSEISEKADSTLVVLKNLREEEKRSGSLVERAGRPAHEQLKRYLRSLKKDLEKLEKLVKKYDLIHNEGPARRLLWALWESDSLTELRRQIGYHEQTLQLWYMHLIGGSLRRLEHNTEDIIETIKEMPAAMQRKIEQDLRRYNDPEALIEALKKYGVKENDIKTNLDTAINYVGADEPTRSRMESNARMSSAYCRESDSPANKDELLRRSRSSRKADKSKHKSSSRRRKEDGSEKPIITVSDDPHSKQYRRSEQKLYVDDDGDASQIIMVEKESPGHRRRASESYVAKPQHTRRQSYTPTVVHLSPNDAMEVNRQRSPQRYAETPEAGEKSTGPKPSQRYHEPPGVVHLSTRTFNYNDRPVSTRMRSDPPMVIRTTSPHWSESYRENPRENEYLAVGGHHTGAGGESLHRRSRSNSDIVVVSSEDARDRSRASERGRRHSEDRGNERERSTHSYTRERRATSRGSQYDNDRFVRRFSTLDRIDSVPLSEEDRMWERRHQGRDYEE